MADKRKITTPIIVAAALTAPPVALASDLYFLQLPNVPGEVTLKGFEGQIEIESFAWGLSRPSSTAAATFRHARLTKTTDKATPKLLLNAVQGTVFKTANFTAVHDTLGGTGAPQAYLKIAFENVRLSSFTPGGKKGDTAASETLRMNYGSVCVTYTPGVLPGSGSGTPATECATNPTP